MASTTVNKVRESEHGLNFEAVHDCASLSDRALQRNISVPVPVGSPSSQYAAYFAQNTTQNHTLMVITQPCYLRAASIIADRVASLGAGTFTISASADNSVFTALTGTVDPEGITANVASNFTIATTNRALVAGDVLFLRAAADNNAITTDSRGVRVGLVLEPTAATTPTKTTGV